EWLRYFGYLENQNNGDSVTLQQYQNALAQMQKNYNIPVTRDIDLLTELEMLLPRCGVPDTVRESEDGEREEEETGIKKRYVVTSNRWNKASVSYRLSTFSNDMPVATQRALVQEAFRVWDAVIPLTFYESNGPVADINIGFFYGDHNDGRPFVENVIAHAFTPYYSDRSDSLSGDIHLNDANKFSADANGDGLDLLAVLVHEIGHSLGMDHSFQIDAVMYEKYGTLTRLTADDIAGVQSIYGANPVSIPTLRPIQNPISTSYDAVYYKDNAVHLIKDDTLFRQLPAGGSSQEYALQYVLPTVPGTIDSVTVLGSDYILIQGHQIWRFDSQWIVRESYPKSLFEMGLPDSVDYVFAMPSEDALYFFKETNYYKLEAGHEFVGGAQPIVTKFGSAAIDADAAFAYDNGKFTSYMDVLFLEPRGNGGRWVG
ncbi:putative macrophage metalloelastase isoform X2, partial [Apostichopus japonicus]